MSVVVAHTIFIVRVRFVVMLPGWPKPYRSSNTMVSEMCRLFGETAICQLILLKWLLDHAPSIIGGFLLGQIQSLQRHCGPLRLVS